MDLYHSWLYVNILNTKWLVRTVVIFTFSANILSPIIVWFIFRGKKVIGKDSVLSGFYSSKIQKQNSKKSQA